MKVYSQNGRNYKATPTIILKGQWLEEIGFAIGDYISVICENGKLVITPDTERAELEQMKADFMEKETKKLRKRFQREKEELEHYIQSKDGVDFIPSSIYLSAVEAKLRTEMGAERMLAEVLAPIRDRYDYVLVDTAPSLGMLQGCSYGEKIGTNPNRNLEAPFIKTIEKIWEYEKKIDGKINRLVDLRSEINTAIEKMENSEERLLLKYRYLKNESWEDISYELNVSYRTVHRIHASALNNFVVPE